jgi:glucokinase
MNNTGKLAAGVDIGGTNTTIGLFDCDGAAHGELSFKTREYTVLDDYIEKLAQDIETLLRNAAGYELAGIGVGAPSASYFSGMIENAVNIDWYERQADGSLGERMTMIPFVEAVGKRFPTIPVVIDNDANATAIGEMMYGGARGMKDFIEITLGSGVGSGVVANGRMIYGHGGTAGELGHVIVKSGGRQCGCGRCGCLETYVSARGIVRTALEVMANDKRPGRLRDVAPSTLDAKIIADLATAGDELALETFEQTGRVLGEALANFAAVTYPEAIFLFGGLAKSGSLLFEPTQRYMDENMLFLYKDKVKLLPSAINDAGAALLGGSALVWAEIEKRA